MAKVNGPLLSLEAHGTLNKKLTFTKTRDQQFARLRNVPTGAPSIAQLEQRAAYSDACAAWQALTQPQKDDWKAAGAAVGLSGFSAFVRYELTHAAPEPLFITQTESLAVLRFIDFGAPAALANLRPMTHLAYARPLSWGQSNLGYLFGKTQTSSTDGLRAFLYNQRYQTLGFDSTSGTNSAPYRNSKTNILNLYTWTHYAGTKSDTSTTGTSIKLYDDASGTLLETPSYTSTTSGSGSLIDDTALPFIIGNRQGLDRAFDGSIAYIALWNRALTLPELQTAAADGPYSVPSGLVFLYANGADLGPNALPISSRSTYVAGLIPPNVNLGTPP